MLLQNSVKKYKITWIDSEEFELGKKKLTILNKYDGILIPGGFGKRGSEGIIQASNYARKKDIPFLRNMFGFSTSYHSLCQICMWDQERKFGRI